jgi:hypothetical protein
VRLWGLPGRGKGNSKGEMRGFFAALRMTTRNSRNDKRE